jgi:hypothetical protein
VPPGGQTDEQVVEARYYVTIDGDSSKVSPDLPRDSNGQAYIDATAGDKIAEVALVRGINAEMRTGQHLLQIKVLANPAGGAASPGGGVYAPVVQRPDLPGIGTITVESHRSYILFTLLTLLLVAAVVFAVWTMRRMKASVPQHSVETSATGR